MDRFVKQIFQSLDRSYVTSMWHYLMLLQKLSVKFKILFNNLFRSNNRTFCRKAKVLLYTSSLILSIFRLLETEIKN